MKALTIYQPYAELIAAGAKRVENRRTRTHHRGEIAIHAAKWSRTARAWWTDEFGIDVQDCSFGAIIAVAEIIDCVHIDGIRAFIAKNPQFQWLAYHRHVIGPFCWILGGVTPVDPIRCRGRQSLWTVPDDVADAVRFSTQCTEFSLSCIACDAGADIASRDQAMRDGWRQLQFDPGGLGWTWLGVCPDCLSEVTGTTP